MTRYAIYNRDTGRMHADTEIEPTDLPPGLSYTPIPDSDEGLMWDEVARGMITRPPKILEGGPRDRQTKLTEDPKFKSLSTAQKARILELLDAHYGEVRYR